MDDHLQRFGTSNEKGNDSDDSSSAGEETSSHQSAAAVAGLAETSFWSTVFADTLRPLPNTVRGSNLETVSKFVNRAVTCW